VIGDGCRIGTGAQILGSISARAVTLADGADHAFADPDQRGGVLKGTGTARNLSVGVGQVVNGLGGVSCPVAGRLV
jgi:hypothetical protein